MKKSLFLIPLLSLLFVCCSSDFDSDSDFKFKSSKSLNNKKYNFYFVFSESYFVYNETPPVLNNSEECENWKFNNKDHISAWNMNGDNSNERRNYYEGFLNNVTFDNADNYASEFVSFSIPHGSYGVQGYDLYSASLNCYLPDCDEGYIAYYSYDNSFLNYFPDEWLVFFKCKFYNYKSNPRYPLGFTDWEHDFQKYLSSENLVGNTLFKEYSISLSEFNNSFVINYIFPFLLMCKEYYIAEYESKPYFFEVVVYQKNSPVKRTFWLYY